MQIRLTDIALLTAAGTFPIGAVLVVDEDIDADLAQKRLAAKTAELVGEDGDVLSPAFAEALDRVRDIFSQLDIAVVAVLAAADTAEASLADARAFVDLMRDPPLTAFDGMSERFYAIKRRVIDAEDAALDALHRSLSSTEGSPAQVVDEAANSAAASEDAASDGPAASEVLSAVEPTVEETTAAPSAVVEPAATDASTDTAPLTEQAAPAKAAAVATVSEVAPPKAKAKAKAKADGNPAAGS